jgi:cell division protein FtsA
MGRNNTIITAVDIGTSSIRVLMGEAEPNSDNINIVGYSEKSSEGVTKGEISDMIKVTSILNEAAKEAEKVSDYIIDPDLLYIAVTGNHITSKDGAGTVIIDSEDHVVTPSHVNEALKSAKGLLTPTESVVINTIDGHCIIDGTHHVNNPIGHTASKLEARSHIIYANSNRLENFQNALQDIGFETSTPVFSGLASSLSVLTSDDFEHGTLTINMGAGTTEYLLFNNYIAKESKVITIGCDHLINDLYLGLEIGLSTAKDIIANNITNIRKSEGHSTIELKGALETREIPIATVEKIIEMRLNETFEIIHTNLKRRKLNALLNNGIVLCGGAANIPGVKEIIRSIFDTPVRIGLPIDISGPDILLNSPGSLTALGLLRYGALELQPKKYNTPGTIIRKLDQKLWSFWKKTWKAVINDTNN